MYVKEEVEEKVGADKPNPNCQSKSKKNIPVAKVKGSESLTLRDPRRSSRAHQEQRYCWGYRVLQFPLGLEGREVGEVRGHPD